MSNDILTAIVHGMKRDEPSPHVRLAATNALLNSLEFTRANFETDVSFLLSSFCTEALHTQRDLTQIFPTIPNPLVVNWTSI